MSGRVRGLAALAMSAALGVAGVWGLSVGCAEAEGNIYRPPVCSATGGCGDRCVNYSIGEECDDGNRLPHDGCDASCRLESGSDAGDTPPRDDGGTDTTPPADDGGTDTTPPRDDGGTTDSGSCPESPCRLRPYCGCAAGEKCTVNFDLLPGTVEKLCGPAGSATSSQTCTADSECMAGTVCAGLFSADPASVVAMCFDYCTSASDCSGGGSICLPLGSAALPGYCSHACDIMTNAGCPSGTSCRPLEIISTGEKLTDCTGGSGSGTQGAYCVDDTDCRPGFWCADTSGLGDTECIAFCRVSSGICSGGLSCNPFDTPMTFGGVEYGYCY
ncbi:MAG: hypothetical protein HY907_11780 [Deltaproteobacteria bacterium]|nr:hypothetical protein [Deltaproteobacteria bacterium]